jgi:Asp-tRNA(Asn)/Glu-tRNA(Gln) amidotransferase A subunit family amidase
MEPAHLLFVPLLLAVLAAAQEAASAPAEPVVKRDLPYAEPALPRQVLDIYAPTGAKKLPVGLQIIGPQLSENTIFRVAHALERAIGFDTVPERLR